MKENDDKLVNQDATLGYPNSNQGTTQRCHWCNLKNPLYVAYHDNEWGIPQHDEHKLFEMLILETFQAGLSWECVLNKREAFWKAFDSFEVEKVSKYDEKKTAELLTDTDIIRNRQKIESAIVNARCFIQIQQECGSFDSYIWGFSRNKLGVGEDSSEPLIHENNATTSPLSDALSKDLKTRGFKFVGSTTMYSFLQAIGIIDSHDEECEYRRR